ncbi:MAG: DUF3786 domain-containing protein [Thermodesulfobacteriota bacterium]
MPRIDDYQQALELGRNALKQGSPDILARCSGSEIRKDEGGRTLILVSFLKDEVSLAWPECLFLPGASDKEPPIQQEIILLHYLKGTWQSHGAPVTGEWIAFQDLPDGRFYLDAFQRRAKIPLVQAFGDRPEMLLKLAGAAFGATPLAQGDSAVQVKVLPLVPMALVLWKGDEEFPPEGNILFDRNIARIFSAEDVAWLSGMVVYPLVGMAKEKG